MPLPSETSTISIKWDHSNEKSKLLSTYSCYLWALCQNGG